MLTKLKALSEKVFLSLIKKKLSAKTVTLKVKYNDFELITRSVTKDKSLNSVDDITQLLSELLQKTEAGARKVRLLGVSVSKLESVNQATIEQATGDEQLRLI